MRMHLPPQAPVVTLNKRLSWKAELKYRAAWRDGAYWYSIPWRAAHGQLIEKQIIEISYPVKSLLVRRDPHNWIRTSKWIIDGLVLGGVLVDDDHHHIELRDATFHLATTNPDVILTFRPAPEST